MSSAYSKGLKLIKVPCKGKQKIQKLSSRTCLDLTEDTETYSYPSVVDTFLLAGILTDISELTQNRTVQTDFKI